MSLPKTIHLLRVDDRPLLREGLATVIRKPFAPGLRFRAELLLRRSSRTAETAIKS
jgi:hypothetical protein